MDRSSRSELLKTVEAQQEKIKKYETKLRDLVLAYKGILKEKEALESSLKALSTVKEVTAAPEKTDGTQEGEDADQTTEENGDAEKNGVQQLRDQLKTLTTALSTVSEEKSKLALSYHSEKKMLLQQIEEKDLAANELKISKQKELQQMEDDMQLWKNKVRTLQLEREKEEDEHAIALRESQKLLSVERMTKEHLEHQLDESRQALLEQESSDASTTEKYEKQMHDLRNEIQTLKDTLRKSEIKADAPSPVVLGLQKETADLKAQHRIDIQQERRRANEAEEQIRLIAQQSEERACALEAKLSELSDVVGNYERLRYQDQSAIQKLKERVNQLDMENMALARAAHSSSSIDNEGDPEDLDVETILDKLAKLKGLLKLANEKSEKPVDIEELLKGDSSTVDGSNLHTRCRDEYQQLKEEFERYKLRAQSVLKNKTSKEPSPNKELDVAREQASELKERLRVLRGDYEDQMNTLKEKEEHFRKALTALEDKHKAALSYQESEYKQKMADLEAEIRKHRDRTIALLAEKDNEIQALKAKSPERLESQYMSTYRRQLSSSSEQECSINEAGASSEETAVSELLGRTSVLGGTPAETSLLHFAQEQARKDVEINSLRRQKHSLELALRELQQNSTLKQENYVEQIEGLKEDIRKLERNKSRESANLEYLKNVVYQYILSTDTIAQQQMLNAISTILEFSPKERTAVFQHISGGWWVYGSKSPKFK